MPLNSHGRKLSFDILAASNDTDDVISTTSAALSRSKSDPIRSDAVSSKNNTKKKKKRNRKSKPLISENSIAEVVEEEKENSVMNGDLLNYSLTMTENTVTEVVGVRLSSQFGELRQRNNVMIMMNGETIEESNCTSVSSISKKDDNVVVVVEKHEEKEEEEGGVLLVEKNNRKENVSEDLIKVRKLERDQTLDWNKLMAEDPNYTMPIEKSPMKYFMEEMYAGNSLMNTTTLSNEKERERVYDTIFRLPWRCELLINIGLFVCVDSFLSLLTIMPTRIIMTLWRLIKTRQFKRLSSAELSDFGCFIVLIIGVTLLQQADISLIYHMIRGQGIIKLYVVYNVLEVFDKLCQSFGGDVIQALFNSADGLANCSPENKQFWMWRFIIDEALAVASSIIHSFILLAQAITLSTCIVAHNNALFAMLVSNNFAEIKSNVFKRYSKDNVHSLVYFDSIERFHISAFVLFVLAQNILEAEGPWFHNFLCNAMVVYVCEMIIDIIKHSFIAKFNDIKPIAFSEFLEDLCKQTLNMQPENAKKNLTFVPLAPACVVIRVLRPVYAAHLPYNPLAWRLFWITVLFAMTFVMLASLKVMIGMALRQHARWYVKRCQRRKLHSD